MHLTRPSILRTTIASLFSATLLISTAHAAQFDIPAGSLDQAINTLAQQGGLIIATDARLTQQLRTQGVKGNLSIEQALSQLLKGTHLESMRLNDGSYTLRESLLSILPVVEVTAIKPLARVASVGDVTLPAVEVSASEVVETTTSPVKGYVAKRSATGNKTDSAIAEIPQSISVMGSNEIKDRGAQSLGDVLQYMPGVVASGYGPDVRGYTWPIIRGFDSQFNEFRDGMRLFNASYNYPITEVHGMERVELLRGPSSLMYGQADAGGIINSISKTPNAAHINEIEISFGSPQHKQVAFDIGGAASDSVQVRLVGLASNIDGARKLLNGDPENAQRTYLAPSLTWQISPATKLTVLADYLQQDTKNFSSPVAGGSPVYYSEYLTGDPSVDLQKQQQYSLGYQFNHLINEQWQFSQNLRYLKSEIPHYIWTWGVATNADGSIERMTGSHNEKLDQLSIDSRVNGEMTHGQLKHKLVFGVDWMRGRIDVHNKSGSAHALDPLNPDFSAPIPAPDVLSADSATTMQQLGFYAQDQVHLGSHWLLSLGARYDIAQQDVDDRLTSSHSEQTDKAWTGRAGLTYLFDSGLAPYLSYATSFSPVIGKNINSETFKPTTGQQWELGIKYQPAAQNMLFTAAIYDLTKQNVQTKHPFIPDLEIQSGEVRSRGLELEAKAEIMTGLQLSSQYTYTDVKITQDNNGNQGKRPMHVPKHTASLWFDYTVQSGALTGLKLGSGVRYMGSVYGMSENTYLTPAYSVVDLSVSYVWQQWQLGLNINNALDKKYAVTCSSDGCFVGDRREIVGSVAYRW